MSMSRRTFPKAMVAAFVAVTLPVKAAVAQVQQAIWPQRGDYFVLGFHGEYERVNGIIWSRIDRIEAWEAIRKHGVYDATTDMWWIKVRSRMMPHFAVDNELPIPAPAGGITALYASHYAVFCADGKAVEVRKNKFGELNVPGVLHTTSVPILNPRQTLLGSDEKPHIEVL